MPSAIPLPSGSIGVRPLLSSKFPCEVLIPMLLAVSRFRHPVTGKLLSFCYCRIAMRVPSFITPLILPL